MSGSTGSKFKVSESENSLSIASLPMVVYAGTKVNFKALDNRHEPVDVTWSLIPMMAGNIGTIGPDGVYRAPEAGSYNRTLPFMVRAMAKDQSIATEVFVELVHMLSILSQEHTSNQEERSGFSVVDSQSTNITPGGTVQLSIRKQNGLPVVAKWSVHYVGLPPEPDNLGSVDWNGVYYAPLNIDHELEVALLAEDLFSGESLGGGVVRVRTMSWDQ
ncbi:hypothetical protein [Pseudomonas sp. Tri1]|uniref:hypothetical protein n=1 Tax=Pseudomonas sp. Tri1 TaxID=2823875 RepID=UPI001B34134D|nr:hypothetical protein [Pseudomonas sp. Tri1]